MTCIKSKNITCRPGQQVNMRREPRSPEAERGIKRYWLHPGSPEAGHLNIKKKTAIILPLKLESCFVCAGVRQTRVPGRVKVDLYLLMPV
jgi:hypothetical protein